MNYNQYFLVNSDYNQDLTVKNYCQIRTQYLSFELHFCNHVL